MSDTIELRLRAIEERLASRDRAQLVQIGESVHIARDMVASLEWSRPTFANVTATSSLIVTLKDGRHYKIEHRPNAWGGQDAYAIERDLLHGE